MKNNILIWKIVLVSLYFKLCAVSFPSKYPFSKPLHTVIFGPSRLSSYAFALTLSIVAFVQNETQKEPQINHE